ESPGWHGIRERRTLLENLLRQTIAQVHHEHDSVRILDIAAGAGRYVLEAMRASPETPCAAVLPDYKPENVAAAQALAQKLGLANVTVCEGDAFDRNSVAKAFPQTTIGIVSGLYELIPSNAPVSASL